MSDADRTVLKKVRWPLRLTWAGLMAERITHAFWPFWSVVMGAAAVLMLGLQDQVAVEVVWALTVVVALAWVGFAIFGLRRFRMPRQGEALDRLDSTLKDRPIQTLLDEQAIGAGDIQSEALWRAHQTRMAERAARAKSVNPDLSLTRRDPFALRYVAILGLSVAMLFGTWSKVGSVTGMGPGGAGGLATGPAWEGWIEPPAYTGLPVLYLADQGDRLNIPQDSRITLRFYGELGALTLAETVSGRVAEVPPASNPAQDFVVTRAGELSIQGDGGRSWMVALLPDMPPEVAITGEPETNVDGQMSLPFAAKDDYGVIGGRVAISLDMTTLDRRYGLLVDPEPRDPILMDLPMPISGNRADFTELLIENFSEHPWAHLPVTFELTAIDAAEQAGTAARVAMPLPARRFFDPLAAALIEQRRDLLWNRSNAPRIAQLLRAISWEPEEQLFPDEANYLSLRVILRRMETYAAQGMADDQRDELAQALWDLAIQIEDGDLDDAMERMKRAQERLNEAMKNGASEQEIARLMQELREATQDYLRQLSRQAQREQEQSDEDMRSSENSMQMGMDDLQRMMDRIQELIEQGRMAEAQEAMRQFQEMMENMQMAQQGGQGGQSPGDQAMEELGRSLREQQGLSDRAFRDLQEQYNPGANSGQSQENEGRNGGQGRGQSHEGQQGENGNGSDGQQGQGSLADRQQALRDELERQRGRLPGAGTESGEAAREALRRAERAMEGAEEALRQDDLAGAIDNQADAMEALREGIRNLGDAMAEAGRRQRGGDGQQNGNAQANNRDPLGRNPGSRGGDVGTQEDLLQGEDVYRRARELLDEIRRRTGEGERPTEELDYLRRLLERF